MEEESKFFQWKKLLVLFSILAIWLVFVLFKGSQSGKSVIGIECGTAPFWILLSLTAAVFLSISFFTRRNQLRNQKKKEDLGYNFLVHSFLLWTFLILNLSFEEGRSSLHSKEHSHFSWVKHRRRICFWISWNRRRNGDGASDARVWNAPSSGGGYFFLPHHFYWFIHCHSVHNPRKTGLETHCLVLGHRIRLCHCRTASHCLLDQKVQQAVLCQLSSWGCHRSFFSYDDHSASTCTCEGNKVWKSLFLFWNMLTTLKLSILFHQKKNHFLSSSFLSGSSCFNLFLYIAT